MKKIFLTAFYAPLKGSRTRAAQLGFFFLSLVIVLVLVSQTVTLSYTKVLEQDKADYLQSTAAAYALLAAHTSLEPGIVLPEHLISPLSTEDFAIEGHPDLTLRYQSLEANINIYSKAGNSFLLVYTSEKDESKSNSSAIIQGQTTLSGASDGFKKAFDQQMAVVATRKATDKSYVSGVAPILSSDGTSSGLLEVYIDGSNFYLSNQSLSNPWMVTIFAVSVAMTIIFYQILKLIALLKIKPHTDQPRILLFGLEGCQIMAFFFSLASSMFFMISFTYIKTLYYEDDILQGYPLMIFVILSSFIFVWGFLGFSNLKTAMMKRFNPRFAMIIFAFVAFFSMLFIAFIPSIWVFLLGMGPIGFSFGMVSFFQREFRIYASSLGEKGFEEDTIHSNQFLGFITGLSVGGALAGIIYSRFGFLAVVLISGSVLLISGVLGLVFIQHCPITSKFNLYFYQYSLALASRPSGRFLWSQVLAQGVQISYWLVFVPLFIDYLNLPLTTLPFYFLILLFVSGIIAPMMNYWKIFASGSVNSMLITAATFSSAILLLALKPDPTILVVSCFLMGIAGSFHGFKYLQYYHHLAQANKLFASRFILEKTIVIGSLLGILIFGVGFLSGNIRVTLLIIGLIFGIIQIAYPFFTLFHVDSHPPSNKRNRPSRKRKASIKGNIEVASNEMEQAGEIYCQDNYSSDYPSYLANEEGQNSNLHEGYGQYSYVPDPNPEDLTNYDFESYPDEFNSFH